MKMCYCSSLVQVDNAISVVIIQHPKEEMHPFNTGRIANLCLTKSKLIVAESLPDTELPNMLRTPSILLYPSLPWLPDINQCNERPTSLAHFQQLIVIDATWRKSKRILHLHPELQHLPRLSLKGNITSSYQIRRTSIAEGLSTLESIVEALQILEPGNNFQPLLKPFERMINLQLSIDKPAIDKPAIDKPAIDKPTADKSTID